MKVCLFCDTNDIYHGILCKVCESQIQKNESAKKEWLKISGKKKRLLRKFRDKLLYKTPLAQLKAYRYIKKVSDVFNIKVQHERIFGPFIIDIYIPRLRSGIEVDGGVHEMQIGYDDSREEYLREAGVKIYRFKNEEIGTLFFKTAIWQIFTHYHTYTHYNKILRRAKDNNIDLNATL